MSDVALVSIFCPDRSGLIAAIAGRLFDLGINLGDSSFAVLGAGAKFTAVCELPTGFNINDLHEELASLEELDDAEINVTPFTLDQFQGASGTITQRITVRGGDQPGLIARLCEVLGEYKANIVRMGAEKTLDDDFVIRLSVNIPKASAAACLATMANTAEGLQLTCEFENIEAD